MTSHKPSCLFALLLLTSSLVLGWSAAVPAPAAAATGGVGSTYVPLAPTRLLDTRYGIGLSGVFGVHAARTFQVTGLASVAIPSSATAVTGNLTVTQQTSNGYLFIGPNPVDQPTSSTLNFPRGDDRANAVTVALGAGGTLSITFVAPTYGQTAQVIFDVSGYFVPDTSGATYVPLTPARLLDTRVGTGLSGFFSASLARTFQVAGLGGVPADATAVTGNLTVTQQTSNGYLYVGPYPMNQPTSSTLNFPRTDDRANGVAVPLGAGGTLSVTFIAGGAGPTAQVIFDVTGYFIPGAGGASFYPIAPERAADARINVGINGPVSSGEPVTLAVAGPGMPVPTGAQAVTGNVTITQQKANGWVAVTPYGVVPPTSTLNFPLGDDRANEFISALSTVGTLGVTYATATMSTGEIIVDISGYFAGGSFTLPGAPAFGGMNLYRASAWSHQATQTWCTGASTQMMLNLIGGGSDHASANQGAYVTYAYYHSRYVARAGAEIDGWANALTAYGAGVYAVGAYSSPDIALRAAATRMRITGKPVGLVVMEGHHAWVMAGFTSTGDDPATSANFTLTSVIIMAPDYGTISYDPAPGYAGSLAYMRTKLTGYTDDFPTIWDHQFAIIAP